VLRTCPGYCLRPLRGQETEGLIEWPVIAVGPRFFPLLAVVECARDARFDHVEAEGFEDVVERAEALEPFGVRLVADAGDDDDGRVGLALADCAEELDAAQSGHGDVRQHHVVGLLAEEGESLLGGVRGVAKVLFRKEFVEGVADRVVVVNDENGGHRLVPAAALAVGSSRGLLLSSTFKDKKPIGKPWQMRSWAR